MVSNIFYFHPYLGKIPILTNIFQLGWNHQLVLIRPFIWLKFLRIHFCGIPFDLRNRRPGPTPVAFLRAHGLPLASMEEQLSPWEKSQGWMMTLPTLEPENEIKWYPKKNLLFHWGPQTGSCVAYCFLDTRNPYIRGMWLLLENLRMLARTGWRLWGRQGGVQVQHVKASARGCLNHLR